MWLPSQAQMLSTAARLNIFRDESLNSNDPAFKASEAVTPNALPNKRAPLESISLAAGLVVHQRQGFFFFTMRQRAKCRPLDVPNIGTAPAAARRFFCQS